MKTCLLKIQRSKEANLHLCFVTTDLYYFFGSFLLIFKILRLTNFTEQCCFYCFHLLYPQLLRIQEFVWDKLALASVSEEWWWSINLQQHNIFSSHQGENQSRQRWHFNNKVSDDKPCSEHKLTLLAVAHVWFTETRCHQQFLGVTTFPRSYHFSFWAESAFRHRAVSIKEP